MTITPTALFGPAPVLTRVTAIYTQPTASTGVVTRASVVNVSAGTATLTVWIVRSGLVRDAGSIVVGASSGGQSIAAGPSVPTLLDTLAGLVLAAGDAIYAVANVSGALNLMINGWVQT